MLQLLMERLDYKKGDQLVFLGDYIDRGPDSNAVVEEMIKQKRYRGAVTLKGNHEAMMIDAFHIPEGGMPELRGNKSAATWMVNGGGATVRSYEGFKPPRSHLEFMVQCQRYHREEWNGKVLWFVHGGFDHTYPIQEQLSLELLFYARWSRTHLKAQEQEFAWHDNDFMVHGHTPRSEPIVTKHYAGIDTGAVFPAYGHLTALVFHPDGTMEFVQVARKEIYS